VQQGKKESQKEDIGFKVSADGRLIITEPKDDAGNL
jgi:hypothetical protein